jgi:hypothetical protein
MLDSRDPFLFQGSTFWDVLNATRRDLAREIEEIDGNRFLNTDRDDLIDYFFKKHRFDVPQLDESKITVDQSEVLVDPRDTIGVFYTGRKSVKGTKVWYTVPFVGDRRFFSFEPSISTTLIPHGWVDGDELLVSFQGVNLNDQHLKAEFERNLEQMRLRLNWLRDEAATFHAQLPGLARRLVEQRRQKLQKDRGLVASLGYPLKRRDDPAAKLVVPVSRRKVVPKLPEETKAPEPYLELAEYEEILDTVQNMAIVTERSPGAFQHLHEEELRWLFLVPLNGLYEGQATGETFNFDGKTDILICVNGKNIFVAECAIWNGAQYLKGKIDQLLGYATWRDSKLAVVIFNRSKDFSSVLVKIGEVCRGHANFKRELTRPRDTWFRCVIAHRDDPNRELTLTVLAFEVPSR